MKYINAKLYIQRTDDTLEDVSDALQYVNINKGDTYMIGDLGCDGVAATMEFSLANVEGRNFSPKKKYGKLKYFRETLTGNGGSVYTLTQYRVVPNSVTLWDITTPVKEWYNYNELPADWTYQTMPDKPWLQLCKNEYDLNLDFVIKLSSNNHTIITNETVPVGIPFVVQYCYMDTNEKNPLNFVGSTYDPLLFENRRVIYYSIEETPVFTRYTVTGNGNIRVAAPSYYLKICRGSVTVWSDSSGTLSDRIVDVDYETGELVFPEDTVLGSSIVIQFSMITAEPKMRFDGYIASISGTRNTMKVTCRDKSKRLQAKMILPGTQRTYTVRKNGSNYKVTDNKMGTVYTDGIPIQTYLQNILNDEFTVNTPVITVVDNPNYVLRQNLDTIWEYKTVWDVLQAVVNVIGYTISYDYDSGSNTFKLKLFAPPRAKTTADYALSSSDVIKVQDFDLDGDSVRNMVMVKYYDVSSQSANTVTVQDITDWEDIRPMLVEEDKSQGIDTVAEATAYANLILSDTKDHLIGWRVTANINANINIFTTVSLNNYNMSSDLDFLGCQSVSHTWDFVSKKFETVIAGFQKVIGARAKWSRLETRPGAFIPSTSKRIKSLVKPPVPVITSYTFDVDFSGATPQGYLNVDWEKPVGVDIAKYIFVYTPVGGKANFVDVTTDAIKVPIAFATSYKFKIKAVSTGQIEGDFTAETTVNCPNALYPYMKNDELHIKTQAVLNAFASRLATYTSGSPSAYAYSTDVINTLVFYEGSYSLNALDFKVWSRNDIKIYTTGAVTFTQTSTISWYIVGNSITISGITGDSTRAPMLLYNRQSTRNFVVTLNKLIGLGGFVCCTNQYNLTKTLIIKMTECTFEATSSREIWTIDSPSSTVTENISIKNNVFVYCNLVFSYSTGSNISNTTIEDNTFNNSKIVNYTSTIFTKLCLIHNKIINTTAFPVVDAFLGGAALSFNKSVISGNTMESFVGSSSKLIRANMQNTALYANVNENSTLYYTGASIVNCQIANNIAF